jgi:archaellum component FlaC
MNGSLLSINTNMQTMQKNMFDMQADINDMKVEMGGMKADINGMKVEMGGMQADIHDLQQAGKRRDKEIANLRNISYDSVVQATTKNAKEFFNLK